MYHSERRILSFIAAGCVMTSMLLTAQNRWLPSAIPDRIILTWKGDPSSSQAVTWRTDTIVIKAVAQIALAIAGPGFIENTKTFDATSTRITSDLAAANYHSVNFDGLKPGTTYVYRVGDGSNWSEWNQFRTASDKPEPFSFVYVGDSQDDAKPYWARVIRQAYLGAPDARFFVYAGDLISLRNSPESPDRDADWGEWFNAVGWITATTPSIPSPGNHDLFMGPHRQWLIPDHWRAQFALPEHGPKGLEETVYYVDYQGVRIISLNSMLQHNEQGIWLEQTLSQNPNRWTVVIFHYPMLAQDDIPPDAPEWNRNAYASMAAMRKIWKPIFDKYEVDLVLQGHYHMYARGSLPRGDRDEKKTSTVYAISVSGPFMSSLKQKPQLWKYAVKREPWMKRVAEDAQFYQVIRVSGSRLKYEARTATGELYDAFELHKRAGKANRLVDLVPTKVPERLLGEAAPELSKRRLEGQN